ncbi:mitochondrial 50S ribosomal protein L5 [Laetiporus sulphureus 93-53]|uniref:Mitochondrial 50S ribosomal protein L5 n=1 Tax=Laetiporus sulphureus 93-53 TaxID=1314785 RepID=A0A165HJ18_9APHY|nr:mitochondrial 50S ribosomal protein L5 [Laetiporus sulphureus 93-53]KZT11791.1 mitochondrial 50S ribosomal protein L5 [Laetiporus sulphureus 93-53]
MREKSGSSWTRLRCQLHALLSFLVQVVLSPTPAEMSADVARAPRIVSSLALRTIRPSKRAPQIRKPLKRDDKDLPIPHVNITVRDTHACRLAEHYYTTVQDNLMYMTYKHEPIRKPIRQIRPKYDPDDPYVKFRNNPPVGGNQYFKQPLPPVTPNNVVELKRIQLHTMIKEALNNKASLLGPIIAFRALSGESDHSGNQRSAEGVQITKGKRNVGGWVRPGQPIGVKVDMVGPKMYDFLGILVEFVFPRLREFPGILMPGSASPLNTPSAAQGIVSFGLPPEALSLFPQIDVNFDAYPKTFGMHVHFVTDATGVGAQNRARALLSGFQVPFARR